MERIQIPEIYRNPIQNRQNTMTPDKEDEPVEVGADWDKVPYAPLPNCPKCKGGGFLHPRNKDGTINYREVVPCDYSGCYGDQARVYRKGEIIQQSGVTSSKQTFETFDPKVPGVAKAYNAAVKIAEPACDFNWLLIYGNVGCGKSHLLNAIANRVMERGMSARLVIMADLLSELRMAMSTNATDLRMSELKQVPYLLIDELGLEYGTDWEKEKIEELLAARWNRGLRTIVATNRDIAELPPRIKSRFTDRRLSRCVLNEAGDYRQRADRR